MTVQESAFYCRTDVIQGMGRLLPMEHAGELGIHPNLKRTLALGQAGRNLSFSERFGRALDNKKEDTKVRWSRPAAALADTLIRTAFSAIPFGRLIVDDAMTERLVQEFVDKEYSTHASGWNDADRKRIANQLLDAVHDHAEELARSSKNPKSRDAQVWLKKMTGRRAEVERKVAHQLSSPQKIDMAHVQRVQQAQRSFGKTPLFSTRQTVFHPLSPKQLQRVQAFGRKRA